MRYVTGPVDLIRMKLVSHGSIAIWQVGSGRVNKFSNLAGRVESGRVNRFFKFRGSGRVGSRHVKFFAGRVGSGDPT